MKRLSHASKVNSTTTLCAQKTDLTTTGKSIIFPDKTASLKESLCAQQVFSRPDMVWNNHYFSQKKENILLIFTSAIKIFFGLVALLGLKILILECIGISKRGFPYLKALLFLSRILFCFWNGYGLIMLVLVFHFVFLVLFSILAKVKI